MAGLPEHFVVFGRKIPRTPIKGIVDFIDFTNEAGSVIDNALENPSTPESAMQDIMDAQEAQRELTGSGIQAACGLPGIWYNLPLSLSPGDAASSLPSIIITNGHTNSSSN